MVGRLRTLLARRGGTFLAVAATGFATQVVTALSGPLVTRMLGPHGRGQMVLVALVALVCSQLAVGGLPAAIAHTVASSQLPARDVVRSQARRWLAASLAPGLVAAVAIVVLIRGALRDRVAFGCAGFSLTIVYAWQFVLYAMVQGERNVRRINFFHLFGLTLYTVTVISLFVVHRIDQAIWLLVIFTLCVTAGLFVGWLMLRRPVGAPPDPETDAALNAFARRSYLSGVGLLDSLGADLFLVDIMLGESKLGLYQVAVSATNLPAIVLSAVGQVLLPRLAAAPSPAAAQAMLRRWLLASVALVVPLVAALEAVIAPVIHFAFGPQFTGMIGCARILIVAWSLLGFRRVLTAIVQAQGRSAYASAVESACLVLMMSGVVVLGLLLGINGAALSMGLAGAASCTFLAVPILRSSALPAHAAA